MKRSALFITLCFSISLIAAGIFHFAGGRYASATGMAFASGYMLIPLLSVVITQLICGEKPLRNCGISWKVNRWWFVAWLTMPLLTIVSILVSCLMPGVSFTLESDLMQQSVNQISASGQPIGPWGVIAITLLSGLMAGVTVNALFAFGEEIAWRGFLYREMKLLAYWKKSLIIGLVWGVWHAPIILMGHSYPHHPILGVFMMIALCILLTPLFIYLREKSGSVIVAAIAHGTMNAVAGLALILLSGYNELLCGLIGAAGFAVLAMIDIILLTLNSKKKTNQLQNE